MGCTCLYLGLPPTKTQMAMVMATAGTAKPTAQEMFSWIQTTTVQANRLPRLMLR